MAATWTPPRKELALHAKVLLATHGYHGATVHDVECEGPDTVILFVIKGEPRTAAIRTVDKKQRIAVCDGWPVL